MSSRRLAWSLPVAISTVAVLAWACTSTTTGTSSGGASSSSGSSGDPAVTPAECSSSCEQKASACGAPTDTANARCADICGGAVSQSQLSCLSTKSCEELAKIDDSASLESVCPKASGSSGGAKFGEACKCKPDSSEGASEFECSGTAICSEGLSCVGTRTQGVDDGKCVGPVCCSGEEDCAAKLGKQSNCASGQRCMCPRGDLECVGDKCTCAGGYAGSRGLCHEE